MATQWQMIGLGAVGGILLAAGIFVFKEWIGKGPLLNLTPFIGGILVIIGVAALYYARYGHY